MSATRIFTVFAAVLTVVATLFMHGSGFFANAATTANTCGTTAECAQAAAMSAKTASDAEILIAAKIDDLAAQVRSLKEALAKDEAALARIRTSDGSTALAPYDRGNNGDRGCPSGQFVSGIFVGYANPGHNDSAIGNLTLECRTADPQAK